MINDPLLVVKEWKKTIRKMETAVIRMPPKSSLFQASARVRARRITGKLWMINPPSFLSKESFPSKASRENISINNTAKIISILAVQRIIFTVITFTILILVSGFGVNLHPALSSNVIYLEKKISSAINCLSFFVT